jgi:hypothetical protein
MSTTIVRYRVAPDCTEENATLVRAVYAELAAFQRFRAALAERCDLAPEATTLTERIGAYRLPPGP